MAASMADFDGTSGPTDRRNESSADANIPFQGEITDRPKSTGVGPDVEAGTVGETGIDVDGHVHSCKPAFANDLGSRTKGRTGSDNQVSSTLIAGPRI